MNTIGEQGAGLPLGEAIRRYSDPALWEEFDRRGGHLGSDHFICVGPPHTLKPEDGYRCSEIVAEAWRQVQDKLATGQLVLVGYEGKITFRSRPIILPVHLAHKLDLVRPDAWAAEEYLYSAAIEVRQPVGTEGEINRISDELIYPADSVPAELRGAADVADPLNSTLPLTARELSRGSMMSALKELREYLDVDLLVPGFCPKDEYREFADKTWSGRITWRGFNDVWCDAVADKHDKKRGGRRKESEHRPPGKVPSRPDTLTN